MMFSTFIKPTVTFVFFNFYFMMINKIKCQLDMLQHTVMIFINKQSKEITNYNIQ
jgi:hypothetical protein